MHTTDERFHAVKKRTQELNYKRLKKTNRTIIGTVTFFSLIVILTVGVSMPHIISVLPMSDYVGNNNAAGVFAANNALGYIIIGLLAFLLGTGITILCVKLHKLEIDSKKALDDMAPKTNPEEKNSITGSAKL